MSTNHSNRIIGAIIGDIAGSSFEFRERIPGRFKLFRSSCSFTDDTVLTVAIADALMHGRTFGDAIWDWGSRYVYAGFGGSFREWKSRRKEDPTATNNSKGNGSGMRATPIGFFAESIEQAMSLAKESAVITHNSPGGIAGAQSIAAAVFMAREKRSKEEIKEFIESTFAYDLGLGNEEIRRRVKELDGTEYTHREREWAENTCPVAIMAFLRSNGYEETLRTAISYGGDVDTVACMAGGIAAAYYGVPEEIIREAKGYLPKDIIDIVNEFDGLHLENRNTPTELGRWAKQGHVLVYGSGKEFVKGGKTGSTLRNNEYNIYTVNRNFRSKQQLEGLGGYTYAIPTVGATLEEVKAAVERFAQFVDSHPEQVFLVTNLGCSKKAGFTAGEIAPLFKCVAEKKNVMLPKTFRNII